MIYVARYNSRVPDDAIEIDTTSRSKNWTRGLSPFVVGPVDLCNGFVSQNFENAWQFCKVYKQHVGEDGDPTDEYWEWAGVGPILGLTDIRWVEALSRSIPSGSATSWDTSMPEKGSTFPFILQWFKERRHIRS